MRRREDARPHKRDGTWYLIRRVPAEFAHLDRRGLVRLTTGIAVADDPRGTRAKAVVQKLDDELAAYWRGLRDGQSAESRIRFEAASRRARDLGLPYQTASEIAAGPVDALIGRVKLLLARDGLDNEAEVAASLGGEARPTLRLSELVAEFEAIHSATIARKSDNQVRKWQNPKKRAVANLVTVIGDKNLKDITRADAVAFRLWWQDRIARDDLDIGTANKDIGHINKMLRDVDMTHQMGLDPVFARLRIAGAVKAQRAAFAVAHIQDAILADGMLADLNAQARHLVYLVADTGLRPSEACNLTEETICLEAAVPHVKVRAIGRDTKTADSERDVPLVGAALAAMKANPAGFPRYRDKEDSLSALVNKVLGNRGLLPTPNHSLYSLRHTFEDRLTAIEAPEKVIATLMGHKWHRPKYGAGPSLEQKQRWMLKIAFRPPVHV